MSREKAILDLELAAANLEDIHLQNLAGPLWQAALYLRKMDQEYQAPIDGMNGHDPENTA
jgi:hypothetical protein